MHINSFSLANFKNLKEVSVSFHPKLNCFVGNNGEGKTNLLDAIYYVCMCKSYFNSTDLYTINNNENFMVLNTHFIRSGKEEEITCGLQKDKKKQFRRNKKEYTRLADHIGQFPVVMVSPSDIQLISEGSEERRKYINSVISQFDKIYLDNTIRYNKVLAQRNRLLKDPHGKKTVDELLDIFDEQLIHLGVSIFNERKVFIERFTPVFHRLYNEISGGKEKVELIYNSQLNDGDFTEMLRSSRNKDKNLQFTNTGIHKDDLLLNLNGIHIKHIGSQGQQKTYLVALKIAQFEFLRDINNVLPLLLLDDIFDKFDTSRVKHILQLVAHESFGQIFITHTNLDRMNAILDELQIDHKLFSVSEGKVVEI